MPSPVFAASDKWSGVTSLERDTRVIVEATDADTVSGRLIAADRYGVTVRFDGQDQIVQRDAVTKITVVRPRSAVPLVIAAVAAGLAVSAGIAYACCGRHRTDSDGSGAAIPLVIATPIAFGTWAQRATREETATVIYERRRHSEGRMSSPGDMDGRDRAGDAATAGKIGRTGDPTDWKYIRPLLPASLQGRR